VADNPSAPQEKPTLEMRIAAIEDKLAGMSVTPEEIAAYHKVAALAGAQQGAAAAPAQGLSPQVCVTPIYNCWHCWNCWIYPPIQIRPPIIVNDCIQYQAGMAGGAAFGRLGG
jgi:hypothetical protein